MQTGGFQIDWNGEICIHYDKQRNRGEQFGYENKTDSQADEHDQRPGGMESTDFEMEKVI